jgi:hypothetical protein
MPCPFGKERQNARKVEHPQLGILVFYVEVRKVVDRTNCGKRVECAYSPVCRTYYHALEFASVAQYPEWKQQKMPYHAENRLLCPVWGIYYIA